MKNTKQTNSSSSCTLTANSHETDCCGCVYHDRFTPRGREQWRGAGADEKVMGKLEGPFAKICRERRERSQGTFNKGRASFLLESYMVGHQGRSTCGTYVWKQWWGETVKRDSWSKEREIDMSE